MAGAGYKLYATGDILTAAQVNTYLQEQTVMVFANAAARTTALASVLAEGMISYLKDTNSTEYYSGSAWVAIGASSASGLTLIKSQTIGSAVSSVTVTDAFSSTYDNYMVTISGGSGSVSGGLKFQLGSTTTGYYSWLLYGSYTGTAVNGFNQNNTTFCGDFGYTSANGHTGVANILSPNLAARTSWNMAFASTATNYYAGWQNGFLNDTTQYTAFTLTTGSGTITGGTIRVYGYQNS